MKVESYLGTVINVSQAIWGFNMNIWWSAIDLVHASYEEMKHRKVVAQGWCNLGNLSLLRAFVPDMKNHFIEVVQLVGDAAYLDRSLWANQDRANTRAPTVMWNLMNVCAGDLVVAIEGTRVRGLCEVTQDALTSYRYQPAWEYAQTIGFPVDWVDWNVQRFGEPPTAPSQGVLGIRSLNKERVVVEQAWSKVRTRP